MQNDNQLATKLAIRIANLELENAGLCVQIDVLKKELNETKTKKKG